MIKRPPSKENLPESPYYHIKEHHPEQIMDYISYYQAMDNKGAYLPYDEFRHRVPNGLIVDLAWALTKGARSRVAQHLLWLNKPIQQCTFIPTNVIQKATTLVDQNTTTAALEWTTNKIGKDQHFHYLFNDLAEDESISSSQLEGAATTTRVAKDMLKRKREPRNLDEKMIVGNLEMMRFITPALIRDLHKIGVDGIDNDKYAPGAFRVSDDIVVDDGYGNILHQPPNAEDIDIRFILLCEWINTDHDDINSSNYIHPLIKAICIHFAIGYEHPFNDGNGRVARALFYWFMFKKDYGAFRYISISSLLKKAFAQYGKSYLYTETDEMDLTYFIDYQCSIIIRAVSEFKSHCQKTIDNIESFNKWLFNSGVYGQLSDKQRMIFQVAKSSQDAIFTARYIQDKLGCSYNTAATALNGLVELNLFDKHKDGKEWIYSLRDKHDIQKTWLS
jgi:Fic family protein